MIKVKIVKINSTRTGNPMLVATIYVNGCKQATIFDDVLIEEAFGYTLSTFPGKDVIIKFDERRK